MNPGYGEQTHVPLLWVNPGYVEQTHVPLVRVNPGYGEQTRWPWLNPVFIVHLSPSLWQPWGGETFLQYIIHANISRYI